MPGRFSHSWALVRASGSVLKSDKELLVFPLISSIAMLAVIAAFLLPMFSTGEIRTLARHGEWSILHYSWAFLFYLVAYFVAFFFNSALVGAALIRLDGGDPTVRDGLRIAASKAWHIFGYALIAATVGLLIRAIEARVGFIGRLVVGLVGIAWSLATFLVVPVLVARDTGPIEAVRESATLLKRTWGENLIGQGGMGLAFFLIFVAIVVTGAALMSLAAMANSWAAGIVAVTLVVIAMLAAMLIHSALAGIYSAALYRFASGSHGAGDGAFDAAMLSSAFRTK